MLKYVYVTVGRTTGWCRMPFAASSDFSLPLARASGTNVDGRKRQHVGFRVEEAQPPPLRLLDNRDLDAWCEGQALSTECRRDRLVCGRNRPRRHIGILPVAGIRDQFDARASFVLSQHIGAGADGMRADVVAVGFDDLARRRCGVRHRQNEKEPQIRCRKPDPQRVPVDYFQSCDRRVVVEAPSSLRLRARFVATDDLALEHPQPR